MRNASILLAAVDGMVDEAAQRCGHRSALPDICANADRVRNLIGAMDVAARLHEESLADELYLSVQRSLWKLARSCVVAE